MKSLRSKLLLSILLITALLSVVIAPWLYFTIKANFNQVLDDRLAASANMLATVMQDYDLSNLEHSLASELVGKHTQNLQIPETIACRVTRLDGSLIARSDNGENEALISAGEGYSYVEDDEAEWRVYKLTLNDFMVTAAEKIDKRDELLSLIMVGLAVPLVFAVVMLWVTSFFIINKVFKPLVSLQRQFSERSGSSLSPIEMRQVPAEMSDVVSEFNALLERVQRVLDNERRFTADAAHELRTPLAGISTQLQVAILKSDKADNESLKKAETALKQLSSMLDQLLMLARLDAKQIATVSTTTDGLKITEKAIAPLKALADQKKISIKTEAKAGKTVNLPEELVILALRNVIKNSIQFSSVGQEVIITITDDEKLTFQIEDSAGGVRPTTLPYITARFVHDKGKGNFGLGLSITSSIVDFLNGELFLENTSQGLRVNLSFPF